MTNRGITGELLQSRGEVEFEWRIVDFISLSAKSNDFYKSSSFHFMDSQWCIRAYPNGNNSDGWMSVFLTRDDPGPPKIVNYSFEIKDESLNVDKFQKLFSACNTFKEGVSSSWGRQKAFNRSELLEKKSSLLPSGNLTLKCCLKNADAEVNTVKPQPIKLTELDTLTEDLGNLLDDSANYDVTLKVQNKEFLAHRLILAARSKVLASMFEHELSESKTGIVDIVDCDPESFDVFLRYLYTAETKGITQDKVLHLYKIADKYAVLKLKSLCVEFMTRHLTADNLSDVAALAHLHEEEELFAPVQAFFNKNWESVLSTKSWEKLLREDYLLANKLMKAMASKKSIQD